MDHHLEPADGQQMRDEAESFHQVNHHLEKEQALQQDSSGKVHPGFGAEATDETRDDSEASVTQHSAAQDSAAQDSASSTREPVRVFRLPIIVNIGGTVLACCAGMVNAISFLVLGRLVSHKTGSLSKVGIGFHDQNFNHASDAATLVLSFLLGSMVCGMLIGKNTVHLGLALYDFCLLGISVLLITTTFVYDERLAANMAAGACGLQNGMATSWGGAVVRTTHVTGLLTDVGLLLGRISSLCARKRCGRRFDRFDKVAFEDDRTKLRVLVTIGLAFLVGIVVGAALETELHRNAFLIPAAITGGAGLLHLAYRVLVLKRSILDTTEIEHVDLSTDPSDLEINNGSTVASLNRDQALQALETLEALQESRQLRQGILSPGSAVIGRGTAGASLVGLGAGGRRLSVCSADSRRSQSSREDLGALGRRPSICSTGSRRSQSSTRSI